MAKSKSKETSVPLIFSLVFFILTTIAFGVMWYLAYSDQEKYIADAKKEKEAQTPLRNAARDAELKARVYRAYLGVEIDGVTDDKTVLAAEAKAGDVISTELDKLNAAMVKKLEATDYDSLPDEFKIWKTDASKKAENPPAEGLAAKYSQLKNKEAVYDEVAKERDAYKAQVKEMEKAAKALKGVQDRFQEQIDTLPKDFKKELAKVTKEFEDATKRYQDDQARVEKKINDITEQRDQFDAQLRKLNNQIADLQKDNQFLREKTVVDKGKFAYDEPQGKVLRKLPEGVVEINLGSAAGVKPGLTFTVLPPDFPQKGRQSRMKMLRMPDGKGGYKSVESFVPKGALEVYEVVSPTLSLARIQPGSELDPIREGVAVGDLLYNSAWRKGVADHIALIGIFDVNGDGTDDIEGVVRDLTKMGIPVDAYYDMKKKAWVGQVTERTRFLVEGYLPLNSVTDPHRDEKTKLLGSIAAAVNEGKQKGVDVVNFRDFFSRMGYKFRLDVTDDKINQATAPYLSNVGVGDPMQQQP